MHNVAAEVGTWNHKSTGDLADRQAELHGHAATPLLTVNRLLSTHATSPDQWEARTETNLKDLIVSDPFTAEFIRIKARWLCREFGFCRSDFEDLQQGMRLYLLEKAPLCSTAHNPRAFATNAIRTWIRMELRYRTRGKRRQSFQTISLERTPVVRDGEITTQAAALLEEDGRRLSQTEPSSSFEHFELREVVEHAMHNLRPEDRTIVNHVAEHGVASAARAFSLSRRQIHNRVARAIGHSSSSHSKCG